MSKKTNALRILEKMNISYELREYDVEENHTAEDAARKIGVPAEQLFKTLIARGEHSGVVVACVPSNATLDMKALAVASGNKKTEMVPLKEVFPLTGYVKGGVSPVGTKGAFPVFMDESALGFDRVSVSAGAKGLQMLVSPTDLQQVAGATFAPLAKTEG